MTRSIRTTRRSAAAQPSAMEAFELILKGGLRAPRKQGLADIVRAALEGPHPVKADPEQAARQRQSDIDAMRSLAELAIEVEQLTANGVEAEVMIHRVRARVKRSGLAPIDRAGEQTRFDRTRHKPIGGTIIDGSAVVVVRPGYVWKTSTEDVLIGKAVVEE